VTDKLTDGRNRYMYISTGRTFMTAVFVVQCWNCRGVGGFTPPQFMSKNAHFGLRIGSKFQSMYKYQTFRHLTPNSIRLIANMLSSRSSALPSLATIAAHTRDFSCGHSLPCYVRLFVFQFSKLVDGPLLPLWSSASSDATTGTAGP